MLWRITWEAADDQTAERDGPPDGRFVLHRHADPEGPHLDLRLECGEYLMGWRIDGLRIEEGPWAAEKGPHPTRWLEHDGDAIREDAGVYTWIERGPDRRILLLEGRRTARLVRAEREPGLPPRAIRTICVALKEAGVKADEVPDFGRLIRDGLTARQRAVERFCGLGRELDGTAFEEGVWRKALGRLSLDEIHLQLRAYEVRFDAKYPPEPISRPEPLPETERDERRGAAMAIVRELE